VSRGLRAGATTDGNPGGNTLAYWGQEKTATGWQTRAGGKRRVHQKGILKYK